MALLVNSNARRVAGIYIPSVYNGVVHHVQTSAAWVCLHVGRVLRIVGHELSQALQGPALAVWDTIE